MIAFAGVRAAAARAEARAARAAAVLAVALAALLAAPATWAAETLGHATSSTFPAGGPASAGGRRPGGSGAAASAAAARWRWRRAGRRCRRRRCGRPGGFGGRGGLFGSAPAAALPASRRLARRRGGFGGGGGGGFGGGRPAGFGGDSQSLNAAIDYAKSHGGGTIGVESQSTAAAAILSSDADVAGLGGFSGRESSVSAAGSRMEVAHGPPALVIADGSQAVQRSGRHAHRQPDGAGRRRQGMHGREGDTRQWHDLTLYDCQGRARRSWPRQQEPT